MASLDAGGLRLLLPQIRDVTLSRRPKERIMTMMSIITITITIIIIIIIIIISAIVIVIVMGISILGEAALHMLQKMLAMHKSCR